MDWAREVTEDVNRILQDQKPLSRVPRIRQCMCGLCGITCIPCCIWSTFWRIVGCPCQCLFRGPSYCVSNNGCTRCSDPCITACVRTVETRYPDLPEHYHDEETKALIHRTLCDMFKVCKACTDACKIKQINRILNDSLEVFGRSPIDVHSKTLKEFEQML